MFIAALLVFSITATIEDGLLVKYDTPHDEDTHPPKLILLRATRAILMLAIGVLFFYVSF